MKFVADWMYTEVADYAGTRQKTDYCKVWIRVKSEAK